jgi:hypothetical protein
LQGPGQNLTFERSTDIISPLYSKICFAVAVVSVLAAVAAVVVADIILLLAGWLAGLLAGWLACCWVGYQSIW